MRQIVRHALVPLHLKYSKNLRPFLFLFYSLGCAGKHFYPTFIFYGSISMVCLEGKPGIVSLSLSTYSFLGLFAFTRRVAKTA